MVAAYTDEQKAVLLDLARDHPTMFASWTKRDYVPMVLHDRIGDALRRIESGEIERLMIFMPPRHGKSELASVRFPAWYLGRHPDHRIIATSHTLSLARSFGRKARDVVRMPEYQTLFPGIAVASGSEAQEHWDIEGYDGGYLAAGVAGPITGHGANVLLIDDPVKDREQANSERQRDIVEDWYNDVALTRLENPGAVILIMTRWHEDDLAGRLLRHQAEGTGDDWEVLLLPAISSEGTALWPEKYPLKRLESLRANNPRTFSALYQQQPTPDEGGVIKRAWLQRRWTYATLPRKWRSLILTVDTAFKDGVGHSYSVIATWATDGVDFYLLNIFRKRMEYPELRGEIARHYGLYNSPRPDALLIEDKAAGQSVIQDLRANTPLPVVAVPARGSKEARLDAVTPLFEAGKVVLPERADWLEEWITEHLLFPNAAHDDQVDTTSLALERLSRGLMQEMREIPLDWDGSYRRSREHRTEARFPRVGR